LSKFRWEYWPENIKGVALQTSDVIVVGAGSVGTPTAMALGELGFKTRVIDMHPSPGQGENKHAIGGIRATHSDPVKILTCRRSLEIFASWEKQYGDNIEWLKGGYVFPVYRKSDETMLKKLLPVQNKYGLNIDYLGPEEIQQVVPGINPRGLRGGTFSPDDGSISPLLAVNAFYRRAVELGVAFHFKERVRRIRVNEDASSAWKPNSLNTALRSSLIRPGLFQRSWAGLSASTFRWFRILTKAPSLNRSDRFLSAWWWIFVPGRDPKIFISTRICTDR
jgi:L-2-hydroxyglutarate oxidase LhgO